MKVGSNFYSHPKVRGSVGTNHLLLFWMMKEVCRRCEEGQPACKVFANTYEDPFKTTIFSNYVEEVVKTLKSSLISKHKNRFQRG